MALFVSTPPAVEPVSVADMHAFLRLDTTMDDALLGGLITAAREWCEEYARRKFVNTGVTLETDYFPGYINQRIGNQTISSPFVSGANAVLVGLYYAMTLPFPPLVAIDSFTFQDSNGNTQTMVDGTALTSFTPGTFYYNLDKDSQPARLTPLFGQTWPIARVITNAVKIVYTAGYGPDAASVPATIQTAIKMLATHWYENRVPDDTNIPQSVKTLLSSSRDLRF